MIMSPVVMSDGRKPEQHLQILLQQGFSRVMLNHEITKIEDLLAKKSICKKKEDICNLVVDRIRVDPEDSDLRGRIADSVQTAYFEGHGSCLIQYTEGEKEHQAEFSNQFELDGITFEDPTVNFFTFNNPYGACKRCEGFGSIIGIDLDLVIPNKSLSVYEGAIACWKGEKMGEWLDRLIKSAYKFDFPIHKPYYQLSKDQKELLWTGNDYFEGINAFFAHVEEQTYKIQYRVMLSRYRGKTICPDCNGTRLRPDANYVKVGQKSISDIVHLQLDETLSFFENIVLSAHDEKVAKRLLTEITGRLSFLIDVGLGYLTLNRLSSSLSGGESQRINLATSLGSSLVGSMYILDEPSIGLHPRDTTRLIKVMKALRDLGNTVIVVEHEEDVIRQADQIIDIGPDAGEHGGELVFQGTPEELINDEKSYTAGYLTHRMSIPIPGKRRHWTNFIEIVGASENNLKNIDVTIPLNVLTVITGVSGSGKSTLVKEILFPAVKKQLGGYGDKTGSFSHLSGDINRISTIEYVDQNPIGRSSRSNPATYLKAFDEIRSLFASQSLAKLRAYKPGYFSFNVPGGRCDQCEGEGVIKVEMQFMADIFLKCDACNGHRFKEEVLEVKYREKHIADVLDMTVDLALEFFNADGKPNSLEKKIIEKIQPLSDVGLGYLRLGQSSNTLSGGEAQRVKLASFLAKGATDSPTLFVFDEPTTGLHIHDISKLLISLNALIEIGHSIVVIEHNGEIIKTADWVIDLGPEGGDHGGELIFAGTPEDLIKCERSYTALFLKDKFNAI
jgi:excinuclease ABC subunit A